MAMMEDDLNLKAALPGLPAERLLSLEGYNYRVQGLMYLGDHRKGNNPYCVPGLFKAMKLSYESKSRKSGGLGSRIKSSGM